MRERVELDRNEERVRSQSVLMKRGAAAAAAASPKGAVRIILLFPKRSQP